MESCEPDFSELMDSCKRDFSERDRSWDWLWEGLEGLEREEDLQMRHGKIPTLKDAREKNLQMRHGKIRTLKDAREKNLAAKDARRFWERLKGLEREEDLQMRHGKIRTLKDAREKNLAAKDARRFRKWENSNYLRIQHEHSQETMAGHDFEETSQYNMHNSVSGYVQSPQSAHLWKNGLPIQPGASARDDGVFDVPEYYQLPPVSTSNSPVGTLPPGFCQPHLQKDNKNTACPVMVNPDEAANTMIVSHNVSVDPNRPDTSKKTDPGHNTDSVYVQNAESAPFESGFPFQRETSGRAEVILDMPEDDHLPRISTSMAASVQPYCSTLPPNSSQSPATLLLVAQNVLVELSGPDTSNEMEVESQMCDHNDSTLPLPGNQDVVASTTMIVALNVPSDLNEPNTSYTMETESQVHDNDDPNLPLPVNQGTIATHSYFGIEVNVMLAGINGAAIVGLSSFAPKDSSLKQVFAAAVGIGFFGSLFAILRMRKPKQATILSKISVIGTSSAILVALGTEFGVNFAVIALVSLIFAVVMMIAN